MTHEEASVVLDQLRLTWLDLFEERPPKDYRRGVDVYTRGFCLSLLRS